jgi:flagellin
MSRINSNVNSLIAQRILGQSNQALTKSLERLSTGLRINRGGDDPAGLIASQKLRAEKTAISSAIGAAERADQVVNIAEGGLQEISNLLIEVQSLVSASGSETGLSDEEKEANQQQVDAILQTIDRIASTTSFNGTKLLNGSLDFTVTSRAASVADYRVNGAKIAPDTDVDVQVIVTASAQHAGLFLSTNGALDLTDATSSFRVEVGGSLGTREFSFASGTALADVATSITNFKQVTGVSATVSGNGIVLKSTEFGSNEFVSFDIIDDGGQTGSVHVLSTIDENTANTTGTSFSSVTNAIRDDGQDIAALVNGVAARGKGKELSVSTDALDLKIELSSSASQTLATIDAFTITGGGATFNLGPQVNVGNQVRLGIGNVAARYLGAESTGYLSDLGSGKDSNVIDGDVTGAQKIVNKAIDQVTSLRGRLGAFQGNVVQATIRSLNIALENTSAAESVISDTDFAEETAALTRAQVLVQVGNQALSIANSSPQNVLSLLR